VQGRKEFLSAAQRQSSCAIKHFAFQSGAQHYPVGGNRILPEFFDEICQSPNQFARLMDSPPQTFRNAARVSNSNFCANDFIR
jgi:hypothetical protein